MLNKDKEEKKAYRRFVIPSLVIFLFVMAFPIILSFVLSLSNFSGGKMFGGSRWKITGLQNYSYLFSDSYFWNALLNNIYLVLISVFGQLPLGMILAYLIYRKTVKGGEFWQGILYVPSVISVIVIGIMWNLIFSPYGPVSQIINDINTSSFTKEVMAVLNGHLDLNGSLVVNSSLIKDLININAQSAALLGNDPANVLATFLKTLGTENLKETGVLLTNLLCPKWSASFLNERGVSMLPILFVTLWCWTGMYLILFLANMQKIDPQTLDSAQIDGAKESTILRHIILPELSGVIMNSAILCISGSLSTFDLIYAMTGGGPARITQVLSIYMYEKAFTGTPNYPLSNAISIMMVVFSLILIGITKAVQKKLEGNR